MSGLAEEPDIQSGLTHAWVNRALRQHIRRLEAIGRSKAGKA
jgi:hypothetical protein